MSLRSSFDVRVLHQIICPVLDLTEKFHAVIGHKWYQRHKAITTKRMNRQCPFIEGISTSFSLMIPPNKRIRIPRISVLYGRQLGSQTNDGEHFLYYCVRSLNSRMGTTSVQVPLLTMVMILRLWGCDIEARRPSILPLVHSPKVDPELLEGVIDEYNDIFPIAVAKIPSKRGV